MPDTTLTPPRGGTQAGGIRAGAAPSARPVPWPALLLLGLGVLTLAGFLAFPTYPNYDSYYSLVRGRELLEGGLPSFETYRAPTQHPLAVAFGAALSLAGRDADLLIVGATHASFVALVAGLYRLGRASFSPLVGLAAAVLLCTRFDFPFLAARAYVDVPYLALILWAAALEAERPRRGTPVLLLLAAAGLLRPDAWVIAGLYVLWCAPAEAWPRRIRHAALAALAPLTWAAVDLAVTGDPLFSLTHTSGLAEELGRAAEGPSEVPAAIVRFLLGLDKAPVLAAAVPGAALAVLLARRRAGVPVALFLVGIATFGLIALAGLSIVFRYLLISALMVMLFAAVLVAGFTLLPRRSRARRPWAVASGVVLLAGLAYTATHTTPATFAKELRFRGDSQRALRALLEEPAVRAARRCGPVSVPNHKLVPKVRWVLGAGPAAVPARSDRSQRRRIRRGVALYATNRDTLRREGFSPDSPLLAVPMAGFERIATNSFYAAYARC